MTTLYATTSKFYAELEYVFNNAPNNRGDNIVATSWYQIYGEDRRTYLCPILPGPHYLRIYAGSVILCLRTALA